MKPTPGLIARFKEVAAVQTRERNALCKNTQATYIHWLRRWHTTPENVQQSLKAAVKAAGILKRVTPHTLRHAYCTHSLRSGNDAPTVQQLMGHDSLETTIIYAHADAARGVSPLDCGQLLPARISLPEFA